MAELTIESITLKEGSKVGMVRFAGHDKAVKFWASGPEKWGAEFKEGATAEATFETVKSQNPDYPDEKFLKSWGGLKPRAASGGGGGYKQLPKTAAEIHSASICGLAKSCIENGMDVKQFESWVDAYVRSIEKVSHV